MRKRLSILQGATRVEVFRLADFHEDEGRPQAERDAIKKQTNGLLDTFTIVRAGQPQDNAFSLQLATALAAADDPAHSFQPVCFDPAVGFRAVNGRASVNVAICFACAGVEVIARDEEGEIVQEVHADLGEARPALLKLSQQAFPDDARLQKVRRSHQKSRGMKSSLVGSPQIAAYGRIANADGTTSAELARLSSRSNLVVVARVLT